VVTHGKIRVVQVAVGAKVVARDIIVEVEIGAVIILVAATSRIMVAVQLEGILEAVVVDDQVRIQVCIFLILESYVRLMFMNVLM